MGETSELVPVMAMRGRGAVHVLDSSLPVNRDWQPGDAGKTICGRVASWYYSGVVMDGDRPCKQCDAKAAVAVEMFAADAYMQKVAEAQVHHFRHMAFSQWVQAGLHFGFIEDEPSCYIHDTIPMTDEEMDQMDETGETDHCIFIVRIETP